jgi:anti-sigma regulatory factor (Ser/Thr protein kinase)
VPLRGANTTVGRSRRPLRVAVDQRDDHVVIRLRGNLTLHDVPRVRDAVVKLLVNTGRVVIDLSGLRCRRSALVTVFPTALVLAGGWPVARLVMFGATKALRPLLASAGAPRTVPLAEDLAAACALLEQRPAQLRRYCDLPLHLSAPGAARMFARQTCAFWSLPELVTELAELVSSELVTNAVEHAHSGSRLTLTCSGSTLRVSVRDYRPTPMPRPRPTKIDAPGRRGLHLITSVARSWGAIQHQDGRTIWANLDQTTPWEATTR